MTLKRLLGGSSAAKPVTNALCADLLVDQHAAGAPTVPTSRRRQGPEGVTDEKGRTALIATGDAANDVPAKSWGRTPWQTAQHSNCTTASGRARLSRPIQTR